MFARVRQRAGSTRRPDAIADIEPQLRHTFGPDVNEMPAVEHNAIRFAVTCEIQADDGAAERRAQRVCRFRKLVSIDRDEALVAEDPVRPLALVRRAFGAYVHRHRLASPQAGAHVGAGAAVRFEHQLSRVATDAQERAFDAALRAVDRVLELTVNGFDWRFVSDVHGDSLSERWKRRRRQ
jgi:hypothetical protein